MKKFIISDTHWNHRFMTQPLGKKGIKIRSHGYEEFIKGEWGKVVNNGDVVIHLGDVIFQRPSELTEILKGLKGTKILVRGNHDNKKDTWFYNHGFDFVCDQFTLGNIVFSHIPVRIPEDMINIHGHFHRQEDLGWTAKPYKDFYTERHYHFSLELSRYRPIEVKEFIDMKDKNRVRRKVENKTILEYLISKLTKW